MTPSRRWRDGGFSLLELLVTLAIIAILGAMAVAGYQQYTTRAAAADLVSAHHNIRTGVLAQGEKFVERCAELVKGYDRKALADPYAVLDFGFEAVGTEGFRPVLTVCAQTGGPGNVAVVTRAYERFNAMGLAEKSPVLKAATASFALRLTEADKALCKVAPAAQAGCVPNSAAASSAPVRTVATNTQPAAAALPACPAGQQMMTHLVNGNWQRACQPNCARGQQLNPATRHCDVDHGGAAPATTGPQPQLSAVQQRQVQAAEQQLTQSLASATTADEAIAKTIAAAQGLPDASLTLSIPGRNVQCPLQSMPQGSCKDMVVGNYCASLPPEALGNCIVARTCPKTTGVCQGVTPEMRRMFDASMQRIVGDWFAQHPGCTTFNQQGC